jgi:replication factor C subunit 1
MFVQKYKPSVLSEIVGNKTNIQSIVDWLNTWEQQKKKCLLVSGVSGIGKTLTVELILNKNNYNMIQLSSDEDRDKEYINANIKPMIKFKKTVFGKKNILLIDDLDCTSDYGFLTTVVECIKDTKIPVICICNDRYNQSFKTLVSYCTDVKFQKPRVNEVQKFITNIAFKEKINIKESSIVKLIENSNNDIRSIMNNLELYSSCKNSGKNEFYSSNKDNSQMNVFDMTNIMFSQNTDMDTKYKTFWMETDLLPLMIHENYIRNSLKNKNQTVELEQISSASDALSNLDLFETSIEVSNWELSPYVAVSCIDATKTCHSKSMVKFPEFLGNTSSKGKKRRTLEDVLQRFITYSKPTILRFRCDYLSYLLYILFEKLRKDTTKGRTTKFVVRCLDMGLNKDDIQENLYNLLLTDGIYRDCKYSSFDMKTKKSISKDFERII